MTRRLVFTSAAENDIAEAFAWYVSRAVGLGDRLLNEISAATTHVEANPFQFPVARRDVRRVLLKRFPYLV